MTNWNFNSALESHVDEFIQGRQMNYREETAGTVVLVIELTR